MGIIAFLVGSRTGRFISLFVLLVSGVIVFAMKLISVGRSRERMQQKMIRLKNLREKVKSDEAIRSMPASERRRRMRAWSTE